jgi:hypothetical protein
MKRVLTLVLLVVAAGDASARTGSLRELITRKWAPVRRSFDNRRLDRAMNSFQNVVGRIDRWKEAGRPDEVKAMNISAGALLENVRNAVHAAGAQLGHPKTLAAFDRLGADHATRWRIADRLRGPLEALPELDGAQFVGGSMDRLFAAAEGSKHPAGIEGLEMFMRRAQYGAIYASATELGRVKLLGGLFRGTVYRLNIGTMTPQREEPK